MSSTRPRNASEVQRDQLKDPEFQKEWERTAAARAVALRLVRYRQQNGLSQTGLARLLGMKQPAVARLEAGDHTPRLETLLLISRKLGLDVRLEILASNGKDSSLAGDVTRFDVIEQASSAETRIVVAFG